jgi:hypothetical protein
VKHIPMIIGWAFVALHLVVLVALLSGAPSR